MLEDETHARQRAFGLRELRDVDLAHVEAAVGQHARRSRELFADEQTVSDPQNVRGERLVLVNRQNLAAEQTSVNHVGIGENHVVVEGRTTRLQVQAVIQLDRVHAVAVRLDQFLQSIEALKVRARRKADEEGAPDAHHVAAFERRGRFYSHDLTTKARDLRLDVFDLRAPRLDAGPREHRQLVEHDCRVLDEHAVRQPVNPRQRDDLSAARPERIAIRAMLTRGHFGVNRLALAVRQLALLHRARRFSRQRDNHVCFPVTGDGSALAATL